MDRARVAAVEPTLPATTDLLWHQVTDCCERGVGTGRAGTGRRLERRPGRGPGLRAVSGASRLESTEKVVTHTRAPRGSLSATGAAEAAG